MEESFRVWADPAAGGGQEELRRQEGFDGLASVPGSFFCGTVVPASQPSNPQSNFEIWDGSDQWLRWFISQGTGVLVLPFYPCLRSPRIRG